jgi:hypothetical protein
MAYAANSSGCGGIPEGTRTVPSSSTHSSGHGNTRNPILCTESTPQKNGRYIIECQPDIEPADAFIYRNESFTLYSREELERLVGILHGELFNGFRPGLFILWAYRMEWKELPTWEWNMLKAETHLFFLGVSPVKIRTDHNGHTVTFYKKTEQYDTL